MINDLQPSSLEETLREASHGLVSGTLRTELTDTLTFGKV